MISNEDALRPFFIAPRRLGSLEEKGRLRPEVFSIF